MARPVMAPMMPGERASSSFSTSPRLWIPPEAITGMRLAAASRIPVIASGGIHNLGDIEKLLLARSPGIIGAITGRAIYEGTLDVAEAQAFCDNYKG